MMDSSNSFVFEKMPEHYDSLLESGKLSDVVLFVGEKEIKVHKKVLTACSPVFAAMFAHSTKESQENRVDIIDIDVEVLELLLRFIYTGKVEIPYLHTTDLLIAADKYQVDILKSQCEESLLLQINIKSVSDIFLFADMYQVTELYTECLHFIINNGTRVMASTGWKKILFRADLLAKLCEHLIVKFSELSFSQQKDLSKITADSVSDLFIHAEKYQVANLIDKCLDYIANHGTEVMATKEWKKIRVRTDLLAKIFGHLFVKYTQMFDE